MFIEFTQNEWQVVRAMLRMCIRYLEEVENEKTIERDDVDSLRTGPTQKYTGEDYASLGGFVVGVLDNPGLQEDAWIFRRGKHIHMHLDEGAFRVEVRRIKRYMKSLAINARKAEIECTPA